MTVLINALQSRKWQNILFIVFVVLIESLNFYELNHANYLIPYAFWLYMAKAILFCLAAYVNLLIIIPLLLKPKKYIGFIVFNLINLAVFSPLIFFITVFAHADIGMEGSNFEHHVIFSTTIVQIILIIIGSTLVYFIKEWYKLKDIANKLVVIEKEKIETEHQALKAQLNPHFLFNTLNNLYAQCIAKSDDAPKTVLKLSGLMSYILYECKEEFVILQKELTFLNDYISLEKLRLNKLDVNFDIDIDESAENIKIAPLLLIPFVENAFKHSRTDAEFTYINMNLIIKNKQFIFTCENIIGNKITKVAEKYHGVGIKNVKKRLALIYPNQHQLITKQTNGNYLVKLEIILP